MQRMKAAPVNTFPFTKIICDNASIRVPVRVFPKQIFCRKVELQSASVLCGCVETERYVKRFNENQAWLPGSMMKVQSSASKTRNNEKNIFKRNAVIPNYSIFGGDEKIESDEITAYFLPERLSCKKSITIRDKMPVRAAVFGCQVIMETVGDRHPQIVPQPSKTQWE